MVAEIKQYLKRLYVKREMNFNEVRLTLAIEDPRLADRRERYGIEDESGVSADEKVAALEAIDAGEIPDDLLALEVLLEDFREWPGLEDDAASEARRSAGPSRYAEIANQAAGIRGTVPGQRPGGVEEKEEESGQPVRVPRLIRRLRRAHLHHHRRPLHHVRQLAAVSAARRRRASGRARTNHTIVHTTFTII